MGIIRNTFSFLRIIKEGYKIAKEGNYSEASLKEAEDYADKAFDEFSERTGVPVIKSFGLDHDGRIAPSYDCRFSFGGGNCRVEHHEASYTLLPQSSEDEIIRKAKKIMVNLFIIMEKLLVIVLEI